MADVIEAAKSGRATCRTCRKAIAKGELRFGEEFTSQFTGDQPGTRWHHLKCAAEKLPARVKPVLDAHAEPIPNKDEIERTLSEAAGKVKDKPAAFPYADRAPTGRAKCIQCDVAIEKGALRVAFEREVDTGTFVTKGPGYVHPACVGEYVEAEGKSSLEDVIAGLRANSKGLGAEEIDEVASQVQE